MVPRIVISGAIYTHIYHLIYFIDVGHIILYTYIERFTIEIYGGGNDRLCECIALRTARANNNDNRHRVPLLYIIIILFFNVGS